MVWYSYLFKHFPQFVVSHMFKGFNAVNEAVKVKVTQLCPTLCNPVDYTWNSPGKSTGVAGHFHLQLEELLPEGPVSNQPPSGSD